LEKFHNTIAMPVAAS